MQTYRTTVVRQGRVIFDQYDYNACLAWVTAERQMQRIRNEPNRRKTRGTRLITTKRTDGEWSILDDLRF